MIWHLRNRVLDFGERVHVMGILNVTPDSFYDGGQYADRSAAVERALQMEEEGVDLIDVGGESSRPPLYGEVVQVGEEEECRRVLPVIEAVRQHSDVPISVDTVKAEVARRALEAGADVVNDISAMRYDPRMLDVVAESNAPVILMHRRGTPSTMQQNTEYADLIGEVRSFLEERIEAARKGGVELDRIGVDPGIGFGKSVGGNFELIRHLDAFVSLGCPVLVGASRKSFIWKTLGSSSEESLEGSLAVAVACVFKGAHILRVHDVKETVRAVRIAEAIASADEDRSEV